MDFSFTEEQTLLQESVSRFMQNDYGFEARQKNASTEQGFSAENWQTFAELGWLVSSAKPTAALAVAPSKQPDAEHHAGYRSSCPEDNFGWWCDYGRYIARSTTRDTIICRRWRNRTPWVSILQRYHPQPPLMAIITPEWRKKKAHKRTSWSSARVPLVSSETRTVVLFVMDATAGISRRDYPTVDASGV